jgi:hypothetical protein
MKTATASSKYIVPISTPVMQDILSVKGSSFLAFWEREGFASVLRADQACDTGTYKRITFLWGNSIWEGFDLPALPKPSFQGRWATGG